jgi:gamma-glutamyltranspeptidase / glutathione hydrolase
MNATAAAQPPVPGRSLVASRAGVVATSQPLASVIGAQVLQQGGSAVDAAIAANAAVGVMEPTGNGLGGDLFAIVYEAETDELHGLNASGWAPAGLTREGARAAGHERMPERGALSVTVPGVVAGWEALHERFGRVAWGTLLEPAAHHAEAGFPVAEVTAGLWTHSVELLRQHEASRATFLVGGERSPHAGEIFRNPDLAGTLRRIAEHGRGGFYQGRTAEAIVSAVEEHGGVLDLADLFEFRPEWVAPITTTYRGWTVAEIPPQGQGIAALLMLNLMERFPIGEWGFHSSDALHLMIEAKKLAYADMLRYTADMRFARVPVRELLSRELAAERAALIDMRRAAGDVRPSSIPGYTDAAADTIYLAVADAAGNVVSLIQSNYMGFGSGIVPRGTGFMLQNRGSLFSLEAGSPNVLEPRKRPLHTIIPGFMRKGEVKIGFGIMGGWNQAQAHAQFVSNVVDHELTIQQALEAGRFTKPTFSGLDVLVEEQVPRAARDDLSARGHELTVHPPRTPSFGYGQAVMVNGEGVQLGASDPRHDGAAVPQVTRP